MVPAVCRRLWMVRLTLLLRIVVIQAFRLCILLNMIGEWGLTAKPLMLRWILDGWTHDLFSDTNDRWGSGASPITDDYVDLLQGFSFLGSFPWRAQLGGDFYVLQVSRPIMKIGPGQVENATENSAWVLSTAALHNYAHKLANVDDIWTQGKRPRAW